MLWFGRSWGTTFAIVVANTQCKTRPLNAAGRQSEVRLENLSPRDIEPANNPIDLIEDIAAANAWAADRQNEDELAVQVTGQWCDLKLWFAWHADTRSLFISCALNMRVPEDRRDAIYPLLAKINERLWIGHFELWSREGWPTFRHTLVANRDLEIGLSMVDDVIETARAECDRFYPAFQFVIWGERSADEAIEAALVEPVGEA